MIKRQYKAEDGLNLLEYLGITNLTDNEIEVFKKMWKDFYPSYGELLLATSILYNEVLPYKCAVDSTAGMMVSTIRDQDFWFRVKETKLEEDLKALPLEEILKKGPHQFYIIMSVDQQE